MPAGKKSAPKGSGAAGAAKRRLEAVDAGQQSGSSRIKRSRKIARMLGRAPAAKRRKRSESGGIRSASESADASAAAAKPSSCPSGVDATRLKVGGAPSPKSRRLHPSISRLCAKGRANFGGARLKEILQAAVEREEHIFREKLLVDAALHKRIVYYVNNYARLHAEEQKEVNGDLVTERGRPVGGTIRCVELQKSNVEGIKANTAKHQKRLEKYASPRNQWRLTGKSLRHDFKCRPGERKTQFDFADPMEYYQPHGLYSEKEKPPEPARKSGADAGADIHPQDQAPIVLNQLYEKQRAWLVAEGCMAQLGRAGEPEAETETETAAAGAASASASASASARVDPTKASGLPDAVPVRLSDGRFNVEHFYSEEEQPVDELLRSLPLRILLSLFAVMEHNRWRLRMSHARFIALVQAAAGAAAATVAGGSAALAGPASSSSGTSATATANRGPGTTSSSAELTPRCMTEAAATANRGPGTTSSSAELTPRCMTEAELHAMFGLKPVSDSLPEPVLDSRKSSRTLQEQLRREPPHRESAASAARLREQPGKMLDLLWASRKQSPTMKDAGTNVSGTATADPSAVDLSLDPGLWPEDGMDFLMRGDVKKLGSSSGGGAESGKTDGLDEDTRRAIALSLQEAKAQEQQGAAAMGSASSSSSSASSASASASSNTNSKTGADSKDASGSKKTGKKTSRDPDDEDMDDDEEPDADDDIVDLDSFAPRRDGMTQQDGGVGMAVGGMGTVDDDDVGMGMGGASATATASASAVPRAAAAPAAAPRSSAGSAASQFEAAAANGSPFQNFAGVGLLGNRQFQNLGQKQHSQLQERGGAGRKENEKEGDGDIEMTDIDAALAAPAHLHAKAEKAEPCDAADGAAAAPATASPSKKSQRSSSCSSESEDLDMDVDAEEKPEYKAKVERRAAREARRSRG